ncbi:MAG TPA: acylphosphatase [Devosia sp.]
MTRAAHLAIRGLVQGVGYRDWTIRKAQELGLSGWVRNRLDGSVEAVVSGESPAVAAMIEACHDGPFNARVEAVDVTVWTDPIAPGFEFRRTG